VPNVEPMYQSPFTESINKLYLQTLKAKTLFGGRKYIESGQISLVPQSNPKKTKLKTDVDKSVG